MFLGVAQFGSVLEWGSRGRTFKSSHPDQQKSLIFRAFFCYLRTFILHPFKHFQNKIQNKIKQKSQNLP